MPGSKYQAGVYKTRLPERGIRPRFEVRKMRGSGGGARRPDKKLFAFFELQTGRAAFQRIRAKSAPACFH